jgi:hypothetical protein
MAGHSRRARRGLDGIEVRNHKHEARRHRVLAIPDLDPVKRRPLAGARVVSHSACPRVLRVSVLIPSPWSPSPPFHHGLLEP